MTGRYREAEREAATDRERDSQTRREAYRDTTREMSPCSEMDMHWDIGAGSERGNAGEIYIHSRSSRGQHTDILA